MRIAKFYPRIFLQNCSFLEMIALTWVFANVSGGELRFRELGELSDKNQMIILHPLSGISAMAKLDPQRSKCEFQVSMPIER